MSQMYKRKQCAAIALKLIGVIMKKILLLISVLLLGASCGDRKTARERVIVREAPMQLQNPSHDQNYYRNATNFGPSTPYYSMPYVDAFGVTRYRREYRPSGLTATDIAMGIMVGNMLSGNARSSGRRPVIINRTVINKYETRRVKRSKLKKMSTASPVKGYKKPTKKRGLTLRPKRTKSSFGSFSSRSKKKSSRRSSRRRR